MRAIIADTGLLYALLNASDQYHKRAQLELALLEQERLAILVSYPVFLESYSLALHRLGFEAAQSFARELAQGVDFINPLISDYTTAMQKAARYPDQKITLCDAVTAVLSERLSLPVWTYDYHFDVMQVSVWRA